MSMMSDAVATISLTPVKDNCRFEQVQLIEQVLAFV